MPHDINNYVSAELSVKKQQELLSQLQNIRQALSFLVLFSPEERRSLAKPSDEALETSSQILQLIEQNPKHFPKELVDREELLRDLALIEMLIPLRDAAEQLAQALDDTLLAARSDSYRALLKAYSLAQLLQHELPGVAASIDPLKTVLEKSGRKKKENKT